jgi:hypothetical protein
MGESSLMHGWISLLGLLGTIAIILTAIGLMLGIGKPADIIKHIGAIIGIVIVLMLIPCILAGAWSQLPLWQQVACAVIGVGVWQGIRPRRQVRNKRND